MDEKNSHNFYEILEIDEEADEIEINQLITS